jgi:hypothetical protein
VRIKGKVRIQISHLVQREGTRRLRYLNVGKPVWSIVGKRIIQVVRIELLIAVVVCMMSHNVCIVELLPINTVCIEIIYVVVFGRLRGAVKATKSVFDHTKEKEVTRAARALRV